MRATSCSAAGRMTRPLGSGRSPDTSFRFARSGALALRPEAALDVVRNQRLELLGDPLAAKRSRLFSFLSLHRRGPSLLTVGSRRFCVQRRFAAQQTLDAHMLVDLLPFDRIAEGHDLPLCALLRRGVEKPWQPPQRCGNAAAVLEGHDQLSLAALDRLDQQRLVLKLQNAHAKHPETLPCAPRSSRVACEAHGPQSPWL